MQTCRASFLWQTPDILMAALFIAFGGSGAQSTSAYLTPGMLWKWGRKRAQRSYENRRLRQQQELGCMVRPLPRWLFSFSLYIPCLAV